MLGRERQREERAHLAAQRGQRVLADAVANDLKKAPVAARSIDRALRRCAVQITDVDDWESAHRNLRFQFGSGTLAWLQPLRQQRIRIELDLRVERDTALRQQLARLAVAPRVEH